MTIDEPRQPPAQHLPLRPVCPCGGHHAPQDADVERVKELASVVLRLSKGIENAARELQDIQEKRNRAA